jgi:membrane protease subunit (stomatin/prohibitin family)
MCLLTRNGDSHFIYIIPGVQEGYKVQDYENNVFFLWLVAVNSTYNQRPITHPIVSVNEKGMQICWISEAILIY